MTAEQVRLHLKYDPEAGTLTWRAGPNAGQSAVSVQNTVMLWGSTYSAPRVAWLLSRGSWPTAPLKATRDLRPEALRERRAAPRPDCLPTAQEVRALVLYVPATGELRWRDRGELATRPLASGALRVALFGRPFAAHHVAWLCTFGQWPTCRVRHVNGNKADNSLDNLALDYFRPLRRRKAGGEA